MTKKEIVRQISDRADLTQLKVKEIVQWTFDAIIETLINDGRIELRNFGVFEVKKRKARRARNPRTDEKVFVPEKNVVTFQPGKEMEERVRVDARVHEPKKKKGKGEASPKKPVVKKAPKPAPAKPAPAAAAASKPKKPIAKVPELPPEMEIPLEILPVELPPVDVLPQEQPPVTVPTPTEPEPVLG